MATKCPTCGSHFEGPVCGVCRLRGVETSTKDTPTAASIVPDQNWLGITALVTSLVGLSLPGLVFGALGLRAARTGRATNRGMALAGTILGAVGVFLSSLALVIVLVVVNGQATKASEAQQDAAALVDVQAIYDGYQPFWQAKIAALDSRSRPLIQSILWSDGSGYYTGAPSFGGVRVAPVTLHNASANVGISETPPYPVTCVWVSYSGGFHAEASFTPKAGASFSRPPECR